MSTTTTVNVTAQRATFAVLLAALASGITTDLTNLDPVIIDGVPTARTDVLARIQAALDAINNVKAARKTLQQAVAAQKVALAEARLLRAGMKRVLNSHFGPSSPKLQVFGFTPARAAKTTVKTKAEAKVKAAATRAARGTKGKKQRLAVKAAPPVTAPVTTPAPLPAKS
jgi:hypothetical protein